MICGAIEYLNDLKYILRIGDVGIDLKCNSRINIKNEII